MNNRLDYIDQLKGLAILLVVIGHLYVMNGQDRTLIVKVIYLFHMPLFFFLSGVVAKDTKSRKFLGYALGKAQRIMAPFISWILIMSAIRQHSPILSITDFMKGGYWYLWVLFSMYIYLFIHCKMNAVINENNKVWVEVLMGIVFYLGLKVTYHFITNRYIADDILGLLHWIGYYPFFMMGYLWNKYNCSAFRFMSEKWIGVLLLLFSTIYGCLVVTNDINNFCISFSLSFVIILGLFLHFKNFHTSNLIGKGLSLLGRYSLVIYLAHYIVLHCFSISRPLALLNENLYIPLGLVFTIIIALLVSFMCIGSGMLAKKYKFIGAILYGEKI